MLLIGRKSYTAKAVTNKRLCNNRGHIEYVRSIVENKLIEAYMSQEDFKQFAKDLFKGIEIAEPSPLVRENASILLGNKFYEDVLGKGRIETWKGKRGRKVDLLVETDSGKIDDYGRKMDNQKYSKSEVSLFLELDPMRLYFVGDTLDKLSHEARIVLEKSIALYNQYLGGN